MSQFLRVADDGERGFDLVDPIAHAGKYVCFYRVGSIWELTKRITTPVAPGNEHVAIPENIKSDLRSGRCLLVLDNSNEGQLNPRNNNHLTFLDQLICHLQPHDQSILFIDQNRHLLRLAGQDDPLQRLRRKIQFFCYDYFLKLIINADLAAADERGSQAFPGFEAYLEAKSKLFLCLLGTPRPHRIFLYRHLLDSPLLEDGLVSFSGFGSPKGAAIRDSLFQQLPRHPLVSRCKQPVSKASIAELLEALPARHIDTEPDTNLNEKARSIPVELYQRTLFSLVSETDFESSALRRITEKSLKSIAMGHPCIILGNSHSLEILALLGFQIFENAIDPAYDRITDPVQRFEAILAIFHETASKAKKNPRYFAEQIYESARFNFRYARSDLRRRYNQLFEMPLLRAMEKHVAAGYPRVPQAAM